MKLMTVRGPIAPDEMGITLTHEHLLIDLYEVIHSYDATLDDIDLAVEELEYFRKAGGATLIETTSIGIGRDPNGLKLISDATGVNVVMGSGWYRECVYPSYVYEKSVAELAEMIVRDLTEGVDDTGIRAGVIGEIGTERHFISPGQERVFRAAARAHRKTGATITTHCTHLGELAVEQVRLLREEGVDPKRIVVGHLGDRRHLRLELPVAQMGAFVEIDHIGFSEFQKDEQRAQNIKDLVDQGFLNQILLSMDVCFNSHLRWFGGKGYDYLLTRFVPMLRKVGLSDEEVQTIVVENPRRAFPY